jgi:ABC-type methionine transport system permease subunit
MINDGSMINDSDKMIIRHTMDLIAFYKMHLWFISNAHISILLVLLYTVRKKERSTSKSMNHVVDLIVSFVHPFMHF